MSVRVRIAPSPTGDPHVGTAYIGLLNYCFAKQHNGQFVLRIEDTDQGRCTPESEQAIFDALRWLGLPYDEGPDVGGEHGPYRQSERVAAGIYQRYVDQLLAQGDAYRCFCTPEILAEMREAQRQAGEPIMYDRRCRDLSPEESQRRADAGEPFVIRMKTPLEGSLSYQDRLRKKQFEKQWAEIDDQVILKSDGWPTYHLAAVVDDHCMGITHVIRAEEWLNSLPKHLLLNQQLGFTAPEYIHVGLLRNADKSKISKRKNPTNLLWYRDQGYLPAALINFLALLGHSHPDGEEFFDLTELLRVFDLDRLSVSGPVFDLDKLQYLQGLWFRQQDDAALKASIHQALDYRLDGLLPMLRERMSFGGDITWLTDFIFAPQLKVSADSLIPKGWNTEQSKQAVTTVHKEFKKRLNKGKMTWDIAEIEAVLKELADKHGWKLRQFLPLLRVAITGRLDSPPLFDSIYHVGQQQVLARLEAAQIALR